MFHEDFVKMQHQRILKVTRKFQVSSCVLFWWMKRNWVSNHSPNSKSCTSTSPCNSLQVTGNFLVTVRILLSRIEFNLLRYAMHSYSVSLLIAISCFSVCSSYNTLTRFFAVKCQSRVEYIEKLSIGCFFLSEYVFRTFVYTLNNFALW